MNTALLTLPLLLSGVSAPAMASPKMLGNPYGEEIDYSVEYEGHTYQRYMYSNKTYLEFNNSESNFALGYLEDNYTSVYVYEPVPCLEVGDYVSVIRYDYPEGFFSWATGDYGYESLPYNACVAFIYEDIENDRTTYWEFYSNDEPACWIFDGNLVEDRMLNEGEADTSLLDLTDSSHIYFSEAIYTEWTRKQLVFTTPRNIPETQPVVCNASLYDIVEDFYDNNLFNNEELENMTASVGDNNMSMRSWLSHTATISTLVVLFVAVFSLLFGIFRLFAHLSVNLFD